MRQHFGHLRQAIAAAAFDLFGNLQMQSGARFREQTLVESVPHQRVLERIVTGFAVKVNQIKRLHRLQPGVNFGLSDNCSQQLRIEPPADN